MLFSFVLAVLAAICKFWLKTFRHNAHSHHIAPSAAFFEGSGSRMSHSIQQPERRHNLAVHLNRPTPTTPPTSTQTPTTPDNPSDESSSQFPTDQTSTENSIENAGALPVMSGVPRNPPSDNGDLQPLPSTRVLRFQKRQTKASVTIPRPTDDLGVLPRVSGTPNKPPRRFGGSW